MNRETKIDREHSNYTVRAKWPNCPVLEQGRFGPKYDTTKPQARIAEIRAKLKLKSLGCDSGGNLFMSTKILSFETTMKIVKMAHELGFVDIFVREEKEMWVTHNFTP